MFQGNGGLAENVPRKINVVILAFNNSWLLLSHCRAALHPTI